MFILSSKVILVNKAREFIDSCLELEIAGLRRVA